MKYLSILSILGSSMLSVDSFLQNNGRQLVHKAPIRQMEKPVNDVRRRQGTFLMVNLWERLEVVEDVEPMWYVINCVAGLEIDLLRQCRQRCDDMEDVEKFVVPMVTTTRSHGANRMVQDTKVKYQGYVFAKLRLCRETYEAVQALDLCRSWMGTINIKGHRKLPPAPVALNEVEIENFGLEDLESQEPVKEQKDENIIVDSEETDSKDAEMEEIIQTVYLGLRVNDMIKVTAKNKFWNEDGIVRRLKGDKIFVRFYTYGSMFDEWLDPSDVRKLTEIEILKGLSGPQEPVTQEDFDGPRGGDSRFDDRGGPDRRNMNQGLGGNQRNRRQDRLDRSGPGRFDKRKNEENWNWYKDNERRGRDGQHSDGGVDIRGSSPRNDWAGNDVDSQWGRSTDRKPRPDSRQQQRENRRGRQTQSNQGGDDWSSFVSPATPKPSQDETDDFFSSLMTDLSKNLDSEDESGGGSSGQAPGRTAASSGEDDFFASLMSEISEDAPQTAAEPSGASNAEDDFFASLSEDIGASLSDDPVEEAPKPSTKAPGGASSGEDDFFASLSEDIGASLSEDSVEEAPKPSPKKSDASADLDDFFSEIGATSDTGSTSDASTELDDFFSEIGSVDTGREEESPTPSGGGGGEADDFFASLEAELDSELTAVASIAEEPMTELEPPAAQVEVLEKKSTPKPKAATKPATVEAAAAPAVDHGDLSKCTVPVLKDMLRERGLKVSGKKAELIERLASTP